ncbi:MAG: magnesium transporter [Proteobacteria bacterium]|nr:magnesium transporter [Pseudomonadota bacterium]
MDISFQPGINQETIKTVEQSLKNREHDFLKGLLSHFHPADLADLLEILKPIHRREIIFILNEQFHPDVLAELSLHVREQVIEQLSPTQVAMIVSKLETDDAITVLEALEEDIQKKILDDIPLYERSFIKEGLSYPKDSAGRLMQREMVLIPPHWTGGETLQYLQQAPDLPETFHFLYIVDSQRNPLGEISLSQLLRFPSHRPVIEGAKKIVHVIPAQMDQEHVANIFQRYGLLSAPVINEQQQIVGVITGDDILTVMQQEASEDFLHFGGIVRSDHTESDEPLFNISYWRLRWLLITFFDTLIASYVISHFEQTLEKIVAVAILMPIVAAMGGNAGMQAVTVTVRALATERLNIEKGFYKLLLALVRKEVLISLINGVVFAFLLTLLSSLWFSDIKLGLVLGCAMILNTIWAGFAGTLLPILLKKAGFDPAIAAGPLLTTTTDVLGFASFLTLATLFLL